MSNKITSYVNVSRVCMVDFYSVLQRCLVYNYISAAFSNSHAYVHSLSDFVHPKLYLYLDDA